MRTTRIENNLQNTFDINKSVLGFKFNRKQVSWRNNAAEEFKIESAVDIASTIISTINIPLKPV